MGRVFLTTIFICFAQWTWAQNQLRPDSTVRILPFHYQFRQFGLVAGIHQGSNTFFELGIYSMAGNMSRCAFGSGAGAFSMSAEYNPFGKVGGAGLTAWVSAATVMMFGANMSAYTDFERMNYCVRPVLGIGGMAFSLTYGRNCYFESDPENRMGGLNTNMISLRYMIPLRERTDPEY